MPRPADQRRAQATADWLAVVAAVAAVGLGAALWTNGEAPTRLARLLAEPRSEAHVAARTIADSLQARPGALSVLGTEAWLIEERGAPAARAELARAVAALLAQRGFGGEDLRIAGASRGSRTPLATITVDGPLTVRVVSFDDEAALAAPPTSRDRATAAATALSWSAAGALAQRIARPLGLAVSAVRMLIGLAEPAPGLPPGGRAGDVLACRPATVTITSALHPVRPLRSAAWRVVILRDGRVIADLAAPTNPCGAPVGD